MIFQIVVSLGFIYYACAGAYYSWVRWVDRLSHEEAYKLANKVFCGTK